MLVVPRVVVVTSMALTGLGATVFAADQASAPRAAMTGHFTEVTAVHEAVIRGDLEAARKAAGPIATRDLTGPANTAAARDELKSLAGRVVSAPDLAAAATATGTMLRACGDCHRLAGVMPVLKLPVRPAVGKTVGHMLEHQRAADQLLQGLVIPSSTSWNQGAQALRTAPLRMGQLPKDPKLTEDVAAGEQRIHQLADQAAGASEPAARAAVYGQMLTACATCHALHKGIWGPSRY
jgi:hypothetical protein